LKISYTVGMPDTKGPMFAWQGDLAEIMENLKAIGYEGIEPFVRNPKDIDPGYFAKLLARTGLEVSAVGTAPIGSEDKLTLTDSSSEVRQAAVARAKDLIDFAAAFDSKLLNIGKFRGSFPHDKKKEGWGWLQEGMGEICNYAARKGIVVAIEPQNKMNLNNLNTTQEGLTWIRESGITNLTILLDTYHMNVEDKSVLASLVDAGSLIGHMHIADSNRGFPGQGSINFVEVLRILKALQYDGYLSLEIAQLPDPLTAAKNSWEYLNFIRKELI